MSRRQYVVNVLIDHGFTEEQAQVISRSIPTLEGLNVLKLSPANIPQALSVELNHQLPVIRDYVAKLLAIRPTNFEYSLETLIAESKHQEDIVAKCQMFLTETRRGTLHDYNFSMKDVIVARQAFEESNEAYKASARCSICRIWELVEIRNDGDGPLIGRVGNMTEHVKRLHIAKKIEPNSRQLGCPQNRCRNELKREYEADEGQVRRCLDCKALFFVPAIFDI